MTGVPRTAVLYRGGVPGWRNAARGVLHAGARDGAGDLINLAPIRRTPGRRPFVALFQGTRADDVRHHRRRVWICRHAGCSHARLHSRMEAPASEGSEAI